MGKMKLSQEVGLHNKFLVVVEDVQTGEVKQEAWAYNLILDQGFNKILTGLTSRTSGLGTAGTERLMLPIINTSVNSEYRYGGYIHIGTGTGTLSAARTELFEFYKGYYGNEHNTAWNQESMSGHYTLKVSIFPGEQFPGPITEIGLASYSAKNTLSTHAILEDSEGAPVSISPGPYDQITIYATNYITLGHGYTSEKVGFVGGPELLGNFFKAVFIDNKNPTFIYSNWGSSKYLIKVGCGVKPIKGEDKSVEKRIISKVLNYNDSKITIDNSLKRILFDGIRFLPQEGIASFRGVREIGMDQYVAIKENDSTRAQQELPVFRSVLPIPGVWTGKAIEAEEVGTGDGFQDCFGLKWGDIVPGSEEIYIQSRSPELQSNSIDYVFNNISVPYGENIGSYNYGIEGKGGNVAAINNAVDGATNTSARLDVTEMSGNSYYSEPGLIFWYPTINYTDKLRVYQGSTGNKSIRAFRFQGSNDLENWTTIVSGEVSNTAGWKVFSFAEVGYQYWRFIVDSSWGTNTLIDLYELEWLQTKPQVQFTVPPENGAAITANYAVDYIPKDENHVLDISFTFSFKDANAE